MKPSKARRGGRGGEERGRAWREGQGERTSMARGAGGEDEDEDGEEEGGRVAGSGMEAERNKWRGVEEWAEEDGEGEGEEIDG
eukprot:765477-Hanusia_phi.AAC.1